jgi:hypothetical protein
MIKYTFCFFSFFFLACPILQGQDYCQIKIPANVDVIRKTPLAERNGLGKTYWICGNARVTFRTGDATLFVEAGCYVSLNAGKYTVYAKDGATIIGECVVKRILSKNPKPASMAVLLSI